MDKREYDIEKYLKGELTPAEMHALEKKALDDPFLAEALEGAEQFSHADFSKDVAELNRNIIKRRSSAWTWPVRIAATLLLLTIAAFIIWTTLHQETEQTLALEKDNITNDRTLPPEPQKQPAATLQTKTEQSSPADNKTENKPTSGLNERPKKLPAESIAEDEKNETDSARPDNRVQKLTREKSLEQTSEVAKIDPGKKDELQSPSAQDIRLAEGYITSVDARPTTVTGRVMSAEDGTPLRDVRVGFKGTSVATKTDASGRYSITGFSENKTLVYSSEGLESTEVKIKGVDSTYLPVKLEITEEAQREAAVETSSTDDYATNVSTIPAHPEKGNRAFKQYLQKNYQYPDEAIKTRVEGVVIIEFKVDAAGSLSEFKIVRGIGKGCDEEVIRLILQGVKWIPTTRDGIPVSDKARVRFKFELD